MRKILIINPLASQQYICDSLGPEFKITALFTLDISNLDYYSAAECSVFDETLYIPPDHLELCIHKLRSDGYEFILNGSEEGTIYYDYILSKIKPNLSNDTRTSILRYDKYEMQIALKNNGLPYINTVKASCSNLSIFNEWLSFPVFCKPINGYGSAGAFLAKNSKELHFNIKKNGDTFDEYLLQEYIEGEEYVVDTFSVAGQHYVSSVQKYYKKIEGGQPVDKFCQIVTSLEEWDSAANFCSEALDVLGLKTGFAHSEVIRMQTGEFRLIEVNNRISGGKGSINLVAEACGLKSQTKLLKEYLNKGKVVASCPKSRFGFSLSMAIYKSQTLEFIKKMDRQFKNIQLSIEIPQSNINNNGDKNLLSALCYLILAGAESSVMQDVKCILNMDADEVTA